MSDVLYIAFTSDGHPEAYRTKPEHIACEAYVPERKLSAAQVELGLFRGSEAIGDVRIEKLQEEIATLRASLTAAESRASEWERLRNQAYSAQREAEAKRDQLRADLAEMTHWRDEWRSAFERIESLIGGAAARLASTPRAPEGEEEYDVWDGDRRVGRWSAALLEANRASGAPIGGLRFVRAPSRPAVGTIWPTAADMSDLVNCPRHGCERMVPRGFTDHVHLDTPAPEPPGDAAKLVHWFDCGEPACLHGGSDRDADYLRAQGVTCPKCLRAESAPPPEQPAAEAKAVAWRIGPEKAGGSWFVATSTKIVEDHRSRGWPITPLYEHPAPSVPAPSPAASKTEARPAASEGLERRYEVRRIDGAAGKHGDCDFFVLDRTHDKFARPALLAYAEACRDEFPALAADLYAAYPAPSPAASGGRWSVADSTSFAALCLNGTAIARFDQIKYARRAADALNAAGKEARRERDERPKLVRVGASYLGDDGMGRWGFFDKSKAFRFGREMRLVRLSHKEPWS